MKKSFSKNKQNEEFVFKNWSYPLDKKWKRSRILSCHSRFLKRESHKQKSYKFHKKNTLQTSIQYVYQMMSSIGEHHQQKVKNKLAAELWLVLNAHPFHEGVNAKLQP